MKSLLTATAMFLCLGAFTQYQYVSINTWGNESAMGIFPGASHSQDIYDIPKTNIDGRDTYFTYYDGTTQSYQSPADSVKYVAMVLPGVDTNQTDTISFIGNYFVKDYAWVDSIAPQEWDFNLIDCDAFYRRSIEDEWIHLNPIADTLINNASSLGYIYKGGDSTDYNQDGFVLALQIKIITYPIIDTTQDPLSVAQHDKIDPIVVKSTASALEFLTPLDQYQINIYNTSGKQVYVDNFVGDYYQLNNNDFTKGIYIYTLQSGSGAYSGKILIY